MPTSTRSGDPDAGRGQRCLRLVQQGPRPQQLVHGRHHREHDPHRVIGGDAQRRPQLREQELRMPQAQTDASDAEEGVLLRGEREVGELLVGAHVERAQGEGAAVELLSGRPVGALLLVLVRQVVGLEEEELGAQQPHAVGAGGERRGDVGGRGHVGRHVHGDAVARGGGLPRPLVGLGLRARPSSLPVLGRPHDVGGRVHRDGAGLAVQGQRRAVRDAQQRRAEADHGRDAQGAGQDGAVRRGPARRAGDAADQRAVQRGGLRRGEVGCDDDALRLQHVAGRPVEQAPEHLVADAAQIRGPGPQVGVVQGIPRRGRRGHGLGPGAGGVEPSREDGVARRAQQGLVLQEQLVGVEDARLVRAGARCHRRPGLTHVPRRGGDRSLESGPLGRGVLRRRVGQLDRGGPQRPGRADGEARRHGQPAQDGPRRGGGRRFLRGRVRWSGESPRRGPARAGRRRRTRVAGSARDRAAGLPRVAEALVGQAPDGRQGLLGLRP